MSGEYAVRYLAEEDLRLWYHAPGTRPRCEIKGDRSILQAQLLCCFPLTGPSAYVSVLEKGGVEVGILRDPSRLDDESRAVLEAELDRVYFTPAIEAILSLKQEATLWKWEVQTQRGKATFYLRGVRDSIHEVAPGRWQIYSVDGQRYEIKDYARLDTESRTLFDSLF